MKRALKEQRAQFERLGALQKQLEEEQEEGKRRLLRRQVCVQNMCVRTCVWVRVCMCACECAHVQLIAPTHSIAST